MAWEDRFEVYEGDAQQGLVEDLYIFPKEQFGILLVLGWGYDGFDSN